MRYLHIKTDDSYKLISYQFTDKSMAFDSNNGELIECFSSVLHKSGFCLIYYYDNCLINLDLNIFSELDDSYKNTYYKETIELIDQINTIENRYKRIKNILG